MDLDSNGIAAAVAMQSLKISVDPTEDGQHVVYTFEAGVMGFRVAVPTGAAEAVAVAVRDGTAAAVKKNHGRLVTDVSGVLASGLDLKQ